MQAHALHYANFSALILHWAVLFAAILYKYIYGHVYSHLHDGECLTGLMNLLQLYIILWLSELRKIDVMQVAS